VQLYLYEPEADRIVEMIGSFDARTKNVVTYVPGTGTTLEDFFNDPRSVQQIGDWGSRQGASADTVAFVYKDGGFPPTVAQARQETVAVTSGRQLASFQAGLHSSYDPGSLNEIAVGHSWGLTNVTTSELFGARYDHVVSLAGAGMVDSWKARSDTDYVHYSYVDFLTVAQPTGLVYDRKVPAYGWGFKKGGWYSSPHDDVLYDVHGRDARALAAALIDNHSLVARDVPENQQVLRDLKERAW